MEEPIKIKPESKPVSGHEDDTVIRCSPICKYINNCGVDTADCPIQNNPLVVIESVA
jgi:hypothetical protein